MLAVVTLGAHLTYSPEAGYVEDPVWVGRKPDREGGSGLRERLLNQVPLVLVRSLTFYPHKACYSGLPSKNRRAVQEAPYNGYSAGREGDTSMGKQIRVRKGRGG